MNHLPPLDEKNQHILKHLSEGLNVRQIANVLFLSYDAIQARCDRMREAVGAKNNTELVFKYRDEICGLKKAG